MIWLGWSNFYDFGEKLKKTWFKKEKGRGYFIRQDNLTGSEVLL